MPEVPESRGNIDRPRPTGSDHVDTQAGIPDDKVYDADDECSDNESVARQTCIASESTGDNDINDGPDHEVEQVGTACLTFAPSEDNDVVGDANDGWAEAAIVSGDDGSDESTIDESDDDDEWDEITIFGDDNGEWGELDNGTWVRTSSLGEAELHHHVRDQPRLDNGTRVRLSSRLREAEFYHHIRDQQRLSPGSSDEESGEASGEESGEESDWSFGWSSESGPSDAEMSASE